MSGPPDGSAPPSALRTAAAEWPRLCFTLNADDLRVLYGQYYQHAYKIGEHPVPRRQRFKLAVAAVGLLGGLFALLILHELDLYTPPSAIVWIAVIATFGVLTGLVDNRATRRASAAKATEAVVSSQQVEGLLGDWVVELRPDGVWADCPAEAKLVRWGGIGDVVEAEGFICIQERLGGGICIPGRAFAAPASGRQFMDRVKAELAARSEGFAQRVIAFLSQTDRPCPACRYNLRGAKELRCPECGRAIRWEDVPEAFKRQDG